MKTYKDEAIDIIIDYASNIGSWGYNEWSPYFEQQSYSMWAAEEMLDLVVNSNKDPECVIESFMHRMDKYSTMAKDDVRFSVARDAAQAVLDQIIFWRYQDAVRE